MPQLARLGALFEAVLRQNPLAVSSDHTDAELPSGNWGIGIKPKAITFVLAGAKPDRTIRNAEHLKPRELVISAIIVPALFATGAALACAPRDVSTVLKAALDGTTEGKLS